MVIDELIVVAGSFNYTEPANEYNDENIFVLGSTHAEVAGVDVGANPCRQLAIYMKQEIERIISLSDPYDPSTSRRGGHRTRRRLPDLDPGGCRPRHDGPESR